MLVRVRFTIKKGSLMKVYYCLLLLLFSFFTITKTQENEAQQAKPAQCYCSDLCGPRDLKPDDTPEFDEEYGVCFCKPRDRENYIPHGCHLKQNQDFENSCKRVQTFKQPTKTQPTDLQPVQ